MTKINQLTDIILSLHVVYYGVHFKKSLKKINACFKMKVQHYRFKDRYKNTEK